MKVAPVSADLLIKLALVAAAIGAGWYVVQRLRDALPSVGAAAAAAAWEISPLNSDNVFAHGVNAGVSAATGRDETLGGWLADVFDPATREVNRTFGANTGAAQGTW